MKVEVVYRVANMYLEEGAVEFRSALRSMGVGAPFEVEIIVNNVEKATIRGHAVGEDSFEYSYSEQTGGIPKTGALRTTSFADLTSFINELRGKVGGRRKRRSTRKSTRRRLTRRRR